MKRYFLITINIAGRDIEAPYITMNGRFFNRKGMIQDIETHYNFLGLIPIIKMIYEFKSEQDYLDFLA